MKVVKKIKLTQKQRLLAVLSCILVIVGTACAITVPLINGTNSTSPAEPPEILDGEAIYLNTTVAYPMISEYNIQYILVENANGSFDVARLKDDNFWLSYDNGDGVRNMIPYTPPIIDAEGGYDYSDLYAIEQNDGYGQIYMLSYLCSAIGTPYFSERIPLPEDSAERSLLLREYGFNKSTAEKVTFIYTEKDKDGNTVEKTHTVTVGGKAISGKGHYFMVDGRNYVYYTSSSYFDYALMGFHSFVKGTLVAAGIASDSAYEPYLTTDFRQWAGEMHKNENEAVVSGSNVIVNAEHIKPLNEGANYVPDEGALSNGYREPEFLELGFDLEALKAHPDFERISAILTSLKVGEQTDKKIITMLLEDGTADSKLLDLNGKTDYSYRICEIESILTDTEEIETEGYTVGEANLIKVAYFYSIGGEKATSLLRHAVLDLSSPSLPEEAENALRQSKVGVLATPLEFDITYTKENTVVYNESFFIADIIEIYDATGNTIAKAAEDSYVTVSCYTVVNGKKSEKTTRRFDLSNMSGIKNGDAIKAAIVGKAAGKVLNVKVYESTSYYEIFRDFEAYRIENVEYFITSKIIAAFSFVNASKRDPYYGESFYENKLDNEYSLYGLNASACEGVVEFLGGVGTGGGVTSNGLSGETVAVGLTHEVFEEYGLYAHKIYFELPRGIIDITEGTEYDSENLLSDYNWLGTLGFTLYISEKHYDKTGAPYRYIGSDMYDIVAKVYGEEFDFVEHSFVDFYARRNIMFAAITNIEKMEVSFNMDDLYGKYTFELKHQDLYIGYDEEGKAFTSFKEFEGATRADYLYTYISAEGERINTEFEKLYAAAPEDNKKVSITHLYNVVNNGGKPYLESIVDTVGVSNFKKAYQLLLLTRYQDTLTKEEQALAYSGTPDMTLRVKMSGANYYTYEFYRFDDRRVMVSLYESSENGTPVTSRVSDFYITTFAFKKLCANYVNLLNGKDVDKDLGYTDIPLG